MVPFKTLPIEEFCCFDQEKAYWNKYSECHWDYLANH